MPKGVELNFFGHFRLGMSFFLRTGLLISYVHIHADNYF